MAVVVEVSITVLPNSFCLGCEFLHAISYHVCFHPSETNIIYKLIGSSPWLSANNLLEGQLVLWNQKAG